MSDSGETTIEITQTYPVPRRMVKLPDDLPEDATVEIADVEQGTRVRIAYTVDAEKAAKLRDLIKKEGVR